MMTDFTKVKSKRGFYLGHAAKLAGERVGAAKSNKVRVVPPLILFAYAGSTQLACGPQPDREAPSRDLRGPGPPEPRGQDERPLRGEARTPHPPGREEDHGQERGPRQCQSGGGCCS